MKRYMNQQKIADLQRIIEYCIDDFELLWRIFPDEEHQTPINSRLKQIQTDLKYNNLRYRKEEL